MNSKMKDYRKSESSYADSRTEVIVDNNPDKGSGAVRYAWQHAVK